jgi:hypothetical protein
MLICRIRSRSTPSSCGRPTRGRDFHRQYTRKPRRCQRIKVSGLMTLIAFRIDGKTRYSQTNLRRSEFVRRTRFGSLRTRMLICWRRTRFSASSLARDLKSERSAYASSSHSAMRRQRTQFYATCHTDRILGNDKVQIQLNDEERRRSWNPAIATRTDREATGELCFEITTYISEPIRKRWRDDDSSPQDRCCGPAGSTNRAV